MKIHGRHRLAALRGRIVGAIEVLIGRAWFYSCRKYNCHNLSFSHEGEDGLLMKIFTGQKKGFYVDVGAHHPQRFSNTYRFYLEGWRGINIDPLPGSKAIFDLIRIRDINIEIGISIEPGTLTYFAFEEPAFNTFKPCFDEIWPSKLLEKLEIPVYPLKDVLATHLPPNTVIDFLSIDVEGLDLSVLRSNDWSQFRPRYVLAEVLGMRDVQDVQRSELNAYMELVGYSLYAKTVNTLFFVDQSLPFADGNL